MLLWSDGSTITPTQAVQQVDFKYIEVYSSTLMINARYVENRIYTRTGPILVALNPWQDLNLYGNDVLHAYRRKNVDQVCIDLL